MADNGSDASSLCGLSTEATFFKTKMCRFNAMGRCSHGSACNFAHKSSELMAAPDLKRTKPCMALARNGTCKKGWNCQYAHSGCDVYRSLGDSYTAASQDQMNMLCMSEVADSDPIKVSSDLEPMKVILPGRGTWMQETGQTSNYAQADLNWEESPEDSPEMTLRPVFEKPVKPGPVFEKSATRAFVQPDPQPANPKVPYDAMPKGSTDSTFQDDGMMTSGFEWQRGWLNSLEKEEPSSSKMNQAMVSGLLRVFGLNQETPSEQPMSSFEDPLEVNLPEKPALKPGLQFPPGFRYPPGLSSPEMIPMAEAKAGMDADSSKDSESQVRFLAPSTIIEIWNPEMHVPHAGEQAQILMVNYTEESYKVKLSDGSTTTIQAKSAQPCSNPRSCQKFDDIVQ